MYKILFAVFFLVWISTAYGVWLNRKLKLHWEGFLAPIGFGAVLFLAQLLYYPTQLFNASSLYIHSASFLVFSVGVYLSIVQFKQLKAQFMHKDMLWVVAFVVVFAWIVSQMSLDLGFADGQMYLNHIAQNVSIDRLNEFNLWTGLRGQEFDTLYLFQGYFHFAGSLIVLINAFAALGIGSLINNLVISVWGLGLLYAVISAMMIVDLVKYLTPSDRQLRIPLLVFTLFFTNFYFWKTTFSFYGNTWRSLFIALMVYVAYRMIKTHETNYKYVFALVFGAALASSSSALFIGFSVLLSYAFFSYKEALPNSFRDLSIMGAPMALFVLAVTYKDHFTIFVFLLGLSLTYYLSFFTNQHQRFFDRLDKVVSKHYRLIFLGLLPGIAIIFSLLDTFLLDPEYIWNITHYFNDHAQYDMVKNYLFLHSRWYDNVLNLFRWLGLFFVLVYHRDAREKRYLFLHALYLMVFILNPLSTSFVAKFLASNVYYRAYEALFNVFTETVLLVVVFQALKSYAYFKIGFILSLVLVVGFTHVESYVWRAGNSAYGFYISQGEGIDPIFKLNSRELEVIRALVRETETSAQERLTLVSHIDGVRTFLPHAYQLFTPRQYWSAWDRVNQEFYHLARRWYGWERRPDDLDYSRTCGYLVEFKVDYVLNEVWMNAPFDQALNMCTTVIYDNFYFKLRKVNTE
jgi:hypothetical protein